MVSPHNEGNEPDRQGGVNQGLITPKRLARAVGDDLGNNTHGREDENVHFRMSQEPEQMLPQQRAAAAADIGQVTTDG
jgi:hypothetical protein